MASLVDGAAGGGQAAHDTASAKIVPQATRPFASILPDTLDAVQGNAFPIREARLANPHRMRTERPRVAGRRRAMPAFRFLEWLVTSTYTRVMCSSHRTNALVGQGPRASWRSDAARDTVT